MNFQLTIKNLFANTNLVDVAILIGSEIGSDFCYGRICNRIRVFSTVVSVLIRE
jgi:hypothetical protein